MYEYFDSFDSDYNNNSVRYLSTPTEFTRNNFLYVQECGKLYAKSNKATKRKELSSFLVACIIDGSGTLTFETRKHPLSKGDVFFIDCSKYHCYETTKENPWSVIWVHFYGQSAEAYYSLFKENYGNVLNGEKYFEIREILKEIVMQAKEDNSNRELLQNELLCRLMTTLNTSREQKSSASPDHIVSYINTRFTEKITLDDISAKFYVSKFHLSRILKNHLGMTFSEYITGKRIGYAKELLRFSDKSIEEIAYMIPINTDIVLEIHCPEIDEETQNKIKKSIKNNYGMEIDDNEYDISINNKRATIFALAGIIGILLNIILENLGRILSDFICVVWWVAIWDMVELLILNNQEIKWKRLNNQQLYDSTIKFVFEETTPKTEYKIEAKA